jgi:urease accessory protein
MDIDPQSAKSQSATTALPTASALLRLLQLASTTLPVGAYSYSEGLEFLIQENKIKNRSDLRDWLTQELRYGAVQLEVQVMLRLYHPCLELEQVEYWNHWLSAAKETRELQQQSWQMGGSLLRLFTQLEPTSVLSTFPPPCNFAIAYLVAATHWQIPLTAAILGYLQSWASNLISAGIKLIPLGQTQGQLLLAELQPCFLKALPAQLDPQELIPQFWPRTCGWGLALASMGHETQYSRLFRS